MAKKPVSLECPSLVVNALKPHYRWYDVVIAGHSKVFDMATDGKKNTFFPGLKLLFPHKEDKPYRLRRSAEGHWEGRNNRGAWLKLAGSVQALELNNMIEQLWQMHIIETMMSE